MEGKCFIVIVKKLEVGFSYIIHMFIIHIRDLFIILYYLFFRRAELVDG